MRILFVTNQMDVGGVEMNIVRLTRALTTRGHEVFVASRPGRLTDDARHAGATTIDLEVALRDPIAVVRDAMRLRASEARHRFDVVHVFSAAAAVLARGIGRRPATVGSIMGLHSSPTEPDMQVMLRCWLTAWGADRLVVMAPAIDAVVRRLPIRRRRLVHGSVVGVELPGPLGDDEVRSVRNELGVGENERVVVTAGRLEPRKSHELYIRAAAAIHRERGGAKFFIAGDGELEASLRREIDELGLDGVVELLGSRDDVPRLLGAADVCVRPGIVEGFIGITVLEAQAMGTPVVSFDLADVRIAIDHDESGLLVPIGDVDALAAEVTRLLDDAATAERISAGGERSVRERYGIDAVTEWLLSVYGELV